MKCQILKLSKRKFSSALSVSHEILKEDKNLNENSFISANLNQNPILMY